MFHPLMYQQVVLEKVYILVYICKYIHMYTNVVSLDKWTEANISIFTVYV